MFFTNIIRRFGFKSFCLERNLFKLNVEKKVRMEHKHLDVYHRCVLCGKVVDKYKFLNLHLNSKLHKQKMEELERERDIMKVIRNADVLRELDERLENMIVS